MIVTTIRLQDGTALRVTAHAARRYHERVCPALDPQQARQHMQRLAAEHGRFDQRPGWVWEEGRDAERWVTLTPDIALVVGRDIAVTCIARGGITPALAHRRERRRRARQAKARYPGPNRIVRAEARSRRRSQRAPRIDEAA